MRIAINTICAVTGGAVTHLQNILPHMAHQAGEDELVVIGNEETKNRIRPPEGITWVNAPGAKQSIVQRLFWENTELPRILKEQKADVVFHPTNIPILRLSIPQVLLIHNVAPFMDEIIAGESIFQKFRLFSLRFLTRFGVRRAEKTIFISQWGRETIERVTGKVQGETIPFGAEHFKTNNIDMSVLDKLNLKESDFILTVSHFYRYKKIEYLIEAHKRISNSPPLVIVGHDYDAEYGKWIREKAKNSQSEVIFTGALDGRGISALMKACKLFVFTSEAENLPITLLEALASGCPIITNRHCSMPEICGDAALYAHPASSSTYQEAMETILEDSTVRRELAEKSIARSAEFKWELTSKRTLQLLKELR